MSPQAAETRSVEEALARVPLFAHLSRRDFRKLARLCVPRTFQAGERVIEEGSIGLGLYVLTGGRIEIFKGEGEGRTVLGHGVSGDVLGEIALIDDRPRSASAVAVEATDCLLLTKESFDLLVRKEPEIAWCIVPSLAERVRELHHRALTAEERLRRIEVDGGGAAAGEAAASETGEESASGTAAERVLRSQYGLMMGSVAALGGLAAVWEEFMTSLADETELAASDRMEKVAERLPEGLISATRAMLTRMEEVPQEILDAFRKATEE